MNRTHFVFIVIFLGILLLFGIVRSCTKDREPSTFTSRVEQATPKRDGGFFKKKEEEVFEEGKFERVRIPEQEKPVGVNEKKKPQYMFDAYQWALDYTDALALITRLILIEKGRYSLKEGEGVPDLRKVYQGLHDRIDGIELPEGQEDLLAQMQKLDTELGKIARDLSRPPTIPELEAAYERRLELDPDVKRLYALLDKL